MLIEQKMHNELLLALLDPGCLGEVGRLCSDLRCWS